MTSFFSLFFFLVESPHKSLLPLSILLLFPSFILFSVQEIVVVQLDVKKDHVEHRAAFKAMRLQSLSPGTERPGQELESSKSGVEFGRHRAGCQNLQLSGYCVDRGVQSLWECRWVCRICRTVDRLAAICSESCAMVAVRENRENVDLNVNVLKSRCDSSSHHGGPSAHRELVVWWWLGLASSGDEWWPRMCGHTLWCLGCVV